VSGLRRVPAPPRTRVQAALGGLLAELPEPLHVVVEQIAGEGGEIDAVARDRQGRAVAIRVAPPGEELTALADLLAQCDWLAPRLRDWLKLNPGLGVAPELGVGGLLLAGQFDARTLAAARRAGGDLALARVSAFDWEGGLHLALEPVSPAEPAGARAIEVAPAPLAPPVQDEPAREGQLRRVLAEVGPEVVALESRFRSSLRDEELGLPRRPRGAPRG
jgi:hypothetical protein